MRLARYLSMYVDACRGLSRQRYLYLLLTGIYASISSMTSLVPATGPRYEVAITIRPIPDFRARLPARFTYSHSQFPHTSHKSLFHPVQSYATCAVVARVQLQRCHHGFQVSLSSDMLCCTCQKQPFNSDASVPVN